MILSEIKIHNVRNIQNAHVKLNSRFNVIIGNNGSGKTSLLESLYLLSCGHSFRSREVAPMISHQESNLTVFATALEEERVSIQKSCSEPTQIKLNNIPCTSTSQLAYALPCQIIYSDLFQIIDAGPSVRRSVLDWGLFHVKHHYLALWKDYRRVLKQRNALLKKRAPYAHFIPWDEQLSILAMELDELRGDYFKNLEDSFYKVLQQLTSISCTIEYVKGWDRKNTGKGLDQILAEHFESDTHKQYTQYGAHQADILIESEDLKARQILSRGQQKILLIALKLAQGALLEGDCLYLFDDLVAELDHSHQRNVLDYLAKNKGQYVITSMNPIDCIQGLAEEEVFSFRMEEGCLERIL